ncbi:related to neutral amino acid permease [Ramularia collo-cygni]|uniref:Related to neutral amino acid permease n=1 Tax=Ramularia collo-cygni TaxID=112498 RepID=A0A2D3V6U2_9PEZI|nr:related to neutral amino acid permease [Ramularia collo-cygni]CZT25126.1 related to neutral amino acid permease [Ramularia collo-cygni]
MEKSAGMAWDSRDGSPTDNYHERDVFGNEQGHDIKYKTLSWQIVAILMIAEIVSNGMLSLPSSLATVGMAPGLILIIFFGVFALYTSWLLVKFKLRHPEVHNMGDAGMIMYGPIGREIFSFGTLLFAVCLAGGQMLSGQIALSALSDNGLCNLKFAGIFAAATFVCSLPRTFDGLGWMSIPSVLCILVAGTVGMVGAGLKGPFPAEPVVVVATRSSDFYTAFFSITNPVFAYCGHFMFFALMSEMKQPRDAMKAAWSLQGFATSYYAIFAAVTYGYIGMNVKSPSFSSLDPTWAKAAYGIAIPNLLIAGSLYTHTASKILFLRLFRNSHHLHSNTILGWGVWVALVALMNGIAFVLAVGVPIFNYLIGLTAASFAAWFTYGIAGMFWLHDSYHDGPGTLSWRTRWPGTLMAVSTVVAGLFICVAGLYVNIRGILIAYDTGAITEPFSCVAGT